MKIKSGQTVQVLSGKDKGKTGQVIQVFPKLNKVVVEGVNTSYKHLKRRSISGSESGERVEYSAPIHVSNVKLVETAEKSKEKTEKKKKSDKKAKETKSKANKKEENKA
jgi:large subunit ribosomal protein L24